jgi:RNA polymerase sigma factor FliA
MTSDCSNIESLPSTTEETKVSHQDLWRHYSQSGPGSSIENRIVEQYVPLVKTIVGRLAMTLPAHVSMDDLYSAGLVGLLNAVRRFNPKGGSSFESYARVRIRGTVFDELRRLDWVPRSVHEKAKRVEKTMQDLTQSKGNVPTDMEMARALNISLDEYQELLEEIKPASYICLDSVGSEAEESGSPYEIVADDSQVNPEEIAVKNEFARLIAERIQQLPDMQRKVLALYYFEDLRLREIAEAFGVTESRICQVHAQAITAIKVLLLKGEADATKTLSRSKS